MTRAKPWGAAVLLLLLACLVGPAAGILGGTKMGTGKTYQDSGTFVVALMDKDGRYFCPATILSSTHLLAAASCFIDFTTNVAKVVHRDSLAGVGSNSLTASGDKRVRIHKVGSIKTHPSFNFNNLMFHPADVVDLAVVTLSDHIMLADDTLQAGALVIIGEDHAHLLGDRTRKKTIFSFGKTSTSGFLQDNKNLFKLDMSEQPPSYCVWDPKTVYIEFGLKRINYFNPKYHLCFAVQNAKGPTLGDAGAPMVSEASVAFWDAKAAKKANDNRFFLLGTYQGMAPTGVEGATLVDKNGLSTIQLSGFTIDPASTAASPKNYYKFTNLLYWGPWVQAASGSILPATYWEGFFKPPNAKALKNLQKATENRWPPKPVNQNPLLCNSNCNSQSSSKMCWCDVSCEANNDCCLDYDVKCRETNRKAKLKTSAITTNNPGCSVKEACGLKSGDCWCDEKCSENGDCCDNYQAFCGVVTNTCVGKCGGKAVGCWCDKNCVKTADCCPDYNICTATIKEEGAGSCYNKCGFQSGDCWCDEGCTANNDCCPNYTNRCGKEGSCEGHCGSKSGEKCWCDATCLRTGDCCADFKTQCPHTKLTPELEHLLTNEAGRRR